MSKSLWKNINYYKSIANEVESSLEGVSWIASESYLEKKKLELLITMWVLKQFNIEMSEYELPCTTRKPINGGPCERFGNSDDMSLLDEFDNFNQRFVIEAYKRLGWDFNIKVLTSELLDCFDYDENEQVIVDGKMLAEYLGCDDVYEYFCGEIDAMCECYTSSELNVTHFIVQKNNRLGKFLNYTSSNPSVCKTRIYKEIKSYVQVLQEPLLMYYDLLQNHALLSDGSFGICYYFMFSGYDENDVTPKCYQVTNLIYACILNLLLDRASEEFNFES